MAFKITANGRVAIFNDEQSMQDALNGGIILPPLSGFLAKGAKFNVIGIDGTLRSVEAQDAIDRYPVLTADEENFIAAFVDAEVANGNWGTNAANYTDSLYDAFWCFGLVTEANALIDMHQVLKLTAVNSGATKVSDGFSFNGTTNFINTTFIPSTDGVNYTLNDAMVECFVHTFTSPTGRQEMIIGVLDGLNNTLFQKQAGNTTANVMNASSGVGTSVTFSRALYGLTRTTATRSDSLKDGVSYFNESQSSQALPAIRIEVGRRAGSGDIPFDGIISTAMIGAGVGFDQVGHNTNVRNLLTSLGVLP